MHTLEMDIYIKVSRSNNMYSDYFTFKIEIKMHTSMYINIIMYKS